MARAKNMGRVEAIMQNGDMTKTIENLNPDPAHIIQRLISTIYSFQLLAHQAEGFGELQAKSNRLIGKAYCTIDLLDNDGGYVYVLVAEVPGKNIAKIGCSKSISNRMYQLGIQIPFPVVIGLVITTPSMYETEREMHKHFAEYRQNGEWFEVPSIIDLIATVREQGNTHFIEAKFSENGDGVE